MIYKDDASYRGLHMALDRVLHASTQTSQARDISNGVLTGITRLDKLIGGLRRPSLNLMVGYPDMGQRELAVATTVNAWLSCAPSDNKSTQDDAPIHPRIVYFSASMPRAQIIQEVLARHTGISSTHLRDGELTEDEFRQLTPLCEMLRQHPIHIEDHPIFEIHSLVSRAEGLHQAGSLDLIVIDSLYPLFQQIETNPEDQTNALHRTTFELMKLSRRMDIPIIVVEEIPYGDNPRPATPLTMSTLDRFGPLADSADMIFSCHIEEYELARYQPAKEKYNDRHGRWKRRMNELEDLLSLEIIKNSSGPLGCFDVHFERFTLRFDCIDDNQT